MKRIIKASNGDQGYRALVECYNALHNAYNVLGEYEDNIEQILNDPSIFEAIIDEVKFLESQIQKYTAE